MRTSSGQQRGFGNAERPAVNVVACALAIHLIMAVGMSMARAGDPVQPSRGESASRFPTVRPQDRHVRELLANAMRYVAPENRMVAPVSGYPFEGWNQDPARGLYLRSFTQLTAIGQYMELLANVAAGLADSPAMSRGEALAQLTRLVETLRRDQRD